MRSYNRYLLLLGILLVNLNGTILILYRNSLPFGMMIFTAGKGLRYSLATALHGEH
jgi:hypothetical protein